MNIEEKLMSTNYYLDNEYLDKYVKLIERNLDNKKIKGVTQSHHVIPKHYFVHNNISVDNSKDNLVNLKFTNHILAHYYLALCSKYDKERISNEATLIRMVGKNLKHINEIEDENFDEYELLYKEYQTINSNSHKGTHHTTSQETRDKIDKSNKGKYKDYKSIYLNDYEEKRVKIDELQYYLNCGWKIGRCKNTIESIKSNYNYNSKGMLGKQQSEYQKSQVSKALKGIPKSDDAKKNMSLGRLGKVLMSNNDLKCSKYVLKDEIQHYIDLGYYKGRLKK